MPADDELPAPLAASVDFKTGIRPILEAHCRPCHFEGGTLYKKMPFDQPQTIRDLGTKLFTRIRDPREQRLIRAFLAQPAEQPEGHAPAKSEPPRTGLRPILATVGD